MTSSARRLLEILLFAVKPVLSQLSALQAWTRLLQLPDDTLELDTIAQIGKVFSLPVIISEQILRLNIDHDLFLEWRPSVADAFKALNFSGGFQMFASRITPGALISLKYCAHELERWMPEKTITDDEIALIRTEAWGLFEAIKAAKLSPDLSKYLLDNVYRIIEALGDYSIFGVPKIEVALLAVAGSPYLYRDAARDAEKTEFGPRLGKVVKHAATAIKYAPDLLQLADAVSKAIGS